MDTVGEIQSNLPLTETTYFILLSLSRGPQHGYAVMKDVQQLSQGRVVLSTGTLYSALKRLLDQGWISRAEGPEDSSSRRVRKAYRLSPLGQKILEAEIGRLQGLVNVARLRSLGDTV
ncbi:MAG TPA: helix-turn-helix transcriptional regulator [Anaerolineales bacterium]|nr:helix-turn-helix transcriptional regulator [Anaerolineales bacterium]